MVVATKPNIEKKIDDILQKVNLANIPRYIKDELEDKLAQTEFATLVCSMIDNVKTDVREARAIHSADVIKSFTDIRLIDVSPIIVMRLPNGRYEVLDGQTRFTWHKENGLDEIPALVTPELSEIAAISLNTILNSKRKNLSEKEQRIMFTKLGEAGWSDEQIANASNFSAKRVNNQMLIERHASPDVKTAIDNGHFSARKVEETFKSLLEEADRLAKNEPNSGIPTSINEQIQTELTRRINFLNKNRQPNEEEITRDWLSQHRIDEIVLRNSSVMWRDYTPEQIARSSIIKVGEADFICEHPDKIDAMIREVTKYKPEVCLVLFCEGAYLYTESGAKVETPIMRASKIVKNVFGVGYFEGAKIDDIQNLKIPHSQEDVFVWWQTVKVDKRKTMIIIDSFGDMDCSSEPFLRHLKEKYPNSKILFLIQDKFGNSRNNIRKLEKDCTTLWAIDVPASMKDFISTVNNKYHMNITECWHSSTPGQTMYLLELN